MKITNDQGLPEAIVNAVKAHDYSKGAADFSISELIRPPQINQLTRQHDEELTEDAADRIWALLGSSIHTILEATAGDREKTEERMFTTISGQIISGQFDNIMLDGNVLTDYKVTSAYAVKGDVKPEWERQLNYYAQLARLNGHEIDQLQIIAILRDWNRSNAMRDPDYPRRNVAVVKVPMWADSYALEEMARDVQAQMDARDGNARPCTDEERWCQPGKVALMKQGRKSAVKLFDTTKEAIEYIKGSNIVLAELGTARGTGDHYLEARPTTWRRCEDYCAVADFCEQWKGDRT